MKILISFFILSFSTITAQQIDYNTAKGFVVEGYDVVSYFTNQAPLKGDRKYTTTYNGANFKFASQDNLDLFNANPEKYIPQYGGYCAYAVALASKKADVNPKTFEIRDDKLYLFYNAFGNNTLKKWIKKDAKVLQQKADKNWEEIKTK